ncbi:type II restriction endonuclease [Hyphomonas sp. NPDC076900]|uniref:type II restriction endonuclease n=1 Tax=Hyphomonas sp. NPDC076900 TaxID=3390570 RepID=UPI003CFFAC38
MNKGYLSEYFTGVWTKLLTRVDATTSSNQHEIGDTDSQGSLLRKVLGDSPRKQDNRFSARYIWLNSEQESISEDGLLSWYDSREKVHHRGPEWRLYYQTNSVTELMDEGDRLYVARQPDDTILFIVVPAGSSLANHVSYLFGLNIQSELGFGALEIKGDDDSALDFISRLVLDEMGIEFEDPNANSLDSIIERFGLVFPTTKAFSDRARLTLPAIDATDDPDAALMAWMDHEEAMFRRLERRIVSERIAQGFLSDGAVDVDGFLSFSLSVQNRRKSRAGLALENHLQAVFEAYQIRFERHAITENKSKPDFLFPGGAEYHNATFASESLTMLASKSSCKDRWRQVLSEAARIEQKHLLTLEPGISTSQTDEMKANKLQLVVPESLHRSFTSSQRAWLLNLGDFVQDVLNRQR